MKQSNRSQQLYLVNVSVVIMLLVLVGILAVVLPKPTVSEVEKRELAAKPQWSLRSWFSGEYAEQYDAYYADTFPQREQLVSLASKLEQMQGVHPDDVRIHPAGGMLSKASSCRSLSRKLSRSHSKSWQKSRSPRQLTMTLTATRMHRETA